MKKIISLRESIKKRGQEMLKNVIEFGKKIKNHNCFIFPKNYKFALFKPF